MNHARPTWGATNKCVRRWTGLGVLRLFRDIHMS